MRPFFGELYSHACSGFGKKVGEKPPQHPKWPTKDFERYGILLKPVDPSDIPLKL